jgi:hypothetical protein
MNALPRLVAVIPLLVLSGVAAAEPVSATFTGVMGDTAVDTLGAFGPAGLDLGGATMSTTISFDTTLRYSSSATTDQYTDAAPGSGGITIGITIGGITRAVTSSYAGLLQAIAVGAATEALGYAADAPGDMLGYGITSITSWAAGTMDTSAAFEDLLTLADPGQTQYLQVGVAPGQYEYLVFTPSGEMVITEPAPLGMLPVALLGLGLTRRRRAPAVCPLPPDPC